MPFSYDIEPNDSSRLRRHMSRVKSDDAQRIEVKALGMNLGQLARGAQVFDPNAYDGDGDGLVQDSTPFERPAVLSNIASIARGLSSTTGGYGSYTPAGSWTVGLTNEEVAERAIPDNPAVFIGMLNAQGPMGSTDVYLLEALNDVIFDPEGVAKIRQSLIKTLDDRPALRSAFDRFGCPPIGLHPKGKPYKGQAHGHYAIFINEAAIDEGAVSRWLGKTPALAKLFNESMIAPKIKGVKRAFSGDNAEDTITHEWGHYLNYLVANIAPDAQLRELAAAMASDSWGYAQWRRTAFTALPKGAERLFSYFGEITSSENWNKKHELPDEDVPFIKSVYGTTSPVEFFAESVQAYFSPNPKDSELLNYEGTVIVEQMLGIRQVSRSGFSSQTSGLKSSTGNSMRGKTPQEIADIVVPKTKEEAIALADAHNALLVDPGGTPYTASEPNTLKLITPKGIDGMDFSPEAVSRMKEMIVEALSNNPNFYEAVQRFGMPPVMTTKPGERLDGSYAVAGVEGFPAITIDSTVREEALVNGFPNRMWEDEPFIKGTSQFLMDPTSDGMFVHEWGHYLNRLVMNVHPDEDMKDLARFWWLDTWDLDEYIPRISKLLRRFIKPDDRVSGRYSYAQRFGKAVKNNKSVNFTGYPHVKTQYGQSQPSEAFAEAVTAVLSSDIDEKDMVSPELRKDVLDILGFSPSAKEVDRAGSSEGRSAGFASKTVTRGLGVRLITKSDPFTPLNGPDWLKDATDEEIAEAVVPTNMDDSIALTVMNTAYGADPANFPTEATVIAELAERLLFKAECTDSTGALIRDANGNAAFVFDVPIDFTPAGRQKAKDMLRRMMAESPEFAWMIRRFGCPPVLIMDEQKLTDLRNQVQALRDSGMDIQLPPHLDSDSIGGFSIATLGITLRTKPGRDDLPMGFNRGIAARRRTGRKITNPDGTIEDETEHWMNNFGISLPDVGIHEWGHWFYSTVLGNKLLYKTYGIRGKMGDRQSRLSYLFPGVPTADVEKMTKEFLDAFDAEGFIPFNTMSEMHIDSIAKAAYRSIGNNLRNRPLPEQLAAAQRFTDLVQDYLNNVVNSSRGWSPSRAQEFADQIALEFPYLVNDMPPLIAGTYATATRQELWAEAVLLFSSPDSKLKAKYLTPEIEAFIAYAFGLKPDRDPNTPYQKPWASRSGFSSSSRVRRLHAAEDSIPDRVSDKDDGLASRTTGASTAKMSREASSTSRFTVGDYDFDITDEDLSTYDWDTAYDQWTTWSGNWRMRHLSSAMMGIEQQPTKGGEESLSTVHEIMRSGELSNAPDHVKESVRESLINTHKTMEKISMGETISDRPLYRGLGSVPDDSEILMAEQGETITFPLSAFTPDRSLATTFADMNAESDKKVILQLRDGAHVASSDYTTQIRDLESDWIEVPIESVTQGEFTVVSKSEKDGYTVVELSHVNTFDPLAGRMIPTNAREGFASSSMRPERRVSDSAIRTLTDNMDFLRDNPPIGKGGKDLDDQWAQKTIEKLRSGEISQEDAFDLMNVVIEILNNGFNEDPSQKENPDGKLLAYQKLSKRLRRLAVGAMDKDDMEDFRREQGIGPTAITEPKPGPYPGGRFGFSSTTARENLSTRTDQRISDIDTQVAELESVNARLTRAISELEATGNWEGVKHDVFITEGNDPKTYSKEQLESNGWSEIVVQDSRNAISARQRKIDVLKKDRDSLEDDKKRLTGDYPETTVLIEELLLDEANVEKVKARALEVSSMSENQRMERFTDPNDPNAIYVVHYGAAKLEGGELDPARSRGQVGQAIMGNTRQINDETARYMVGKRDDAKRDISILEDMKRQIDSDGVVDFDAIRKADLKDPQRVGRARMLLGLNRSDPESSTITPEARQIANIDGAIGDKNIVLSRLDKVADKLVADDYQYSSTYRASSLQDLFGSYGGRYAEGDDTKRSSNTGIHIFKVRIGDDATEENNVGETHLVGKHTPIASLVVDSNASSDNPGREIWKGWLDLVIQQDIGKNDAITLSEDGRMPDMPGREIRGKSVQWVDLATKSFVSSAPSFDTKSLKYTKPELRERIKNRIMAGSKGGNPGQWSARKAQLVALEYRKAGGGYKGGLRKTQRSLNKWTREKWTTSDGKPAIRKGGTRRYLPSTAWSRLTPAQRAATNRKKIIGSRQGNQFVANTRSAENASRRARN